MHDYCMIRLTLVMARCLFRCLVACGKVRAPYTPRIVRLDLRLVVSLVLAGC